jgi:hypothetical protein
MSPTHSLVSSYAMHTNLLCACWHLEAMKGLSSLTSCRLSILSRPLSPLIWTQLTLLVPALGIRPPFPKMAPPFTGPAHTPLPGSGTILPTILTDSVGEITPIIIFYVLARLTFVQLSLSKNLYQGLVKGNYIFEL